MTWANRQGQKSSGLRRREVKNNYTELYKHEKMPSRVIDW